MTDSGKIVPFTNLGEISAEAAHWVVRLDSGDLSPQEQAAFEEWRGRSLHHREAMAKLGRLWAGLDELIAQPDFAARNTEIAGPAPAAIARGGRAARSVAYRLLAAAAAIAAIVAGGDLAYQLLPRGDTGTPTSYQTAIGEQRTVTLADGSTILLNTDSEVEVRYTAPRRDIELLRGEAYFDVAPNHERPFTVFAGDGAVQAVGTAFAVRLTGGAVDVTVTRGKVELASFRPGANPRAVNPVHGPAAAPKRDLGLIVAGQDAVFRDQLENLSSVPTPEMNRKLAWRQGVLAFTGDPLSKVVNDISRYTDVKIEIGDPKLIGVRVGGYFRIGQVDAMLAALEENFGVRAVRVNTHLVRLFPAT